MKQKESQCPNVGCIWTWLHIAPKQPPTRDLRVAVVVSGAANIGSAPSIDLRTLRYERQLCRPGQEPSNDRNEGAKQSSIRRLVHGRFGLNSRRSPIPLCALHLRPSAHRSTVWRKAARKPHDMGRKPGERGGIRTLDPMIKSHVLYRLSYALPPWRPAGDGHTGSVPPRRYRSLRTALPYSTDPPMATEPLVISCRRRTGRAGARPRPDGPNSGPAGELWDFLNPHKEKASSLPRESAGFIWTRPRLCR